MKNAGAADVEHLWEAIRTQHPPALFQALSNRLLTEEMACFIARSRSTPAEGLGVLAADVRFKKNYKVQLSLCLNPRTPQRIVLNLLKSIKIFDLADLSRNRFITSVTRQRVELMITQRLEGMPSGVKISLARKASGEIVIKLMHKSDPQVIEACLMSPLLTEDILYRLIIRPSTKPAIIHAIAEHAKWRLRYRVRYGLIRNFHTPMRHVQEFIRAMKLTDLRDLYADTRVPSSTKPFIYREIQSRGSEVAHPRGVIYEVTEEDDHVLPELWGSGELAPVPTEFSEYSEYTSDDVYALDEDFSEDYTGDYTGDFTGHLPPDSDETGQEATSPDPDAPSEDAAEDAAPEDSQEGSQEGDR